MKRIFLLFNNFKYSDLCRDEFINIVTHSFFLLILKFSKLVVVLMSIQLALITYSSHNIDLNIIIGITISIFLIFISTNIIKHLKNSFLKYLSGHTKKTIAATNMAYIEISHYFGSCLLSIAILLFFLFISPIFIFGWIISIFLIIFFNVKKQPEIILALTLIILSYYIISSDYDNNELLSFIFLLLAFRYWFGETFKVIKNTRFAQPNIKIISSTMNIFIKH